MVVHDVDSLGKYSSLIVPGEQRKFFTTEPLGVNEVGGVVLASGVKRISTLVQSYFKNRLLHFWGITVAGAAVVSPFSFKAVGESLSLAFLSYGNILWGIASSLGLAVLSIKGIIQYAAALNDCRKIGDVSGSFRSTVQLGLNGILAASSGLMLASCLKFFTYVPQPIIEAMKVSVSSLFGIYYVITMLTEVYKLGRAIQLSSFLSSVDPETGLTRLVEAYGIKKGDKVLSYDQFIQSWKICDQDYKSFLPQEFLDNLQPLLEKTVLSKHPQWHSESMLSKGGDGNQRESSLLDLQGKMMVGKVDGPMDKLPIHSQKLHSSLQSITVTNHAIGEMDRMEKERLVQKLNRIIIKQQLYSSLQILGNLLALAGTIALELTGLSFIARCGILIGGILTWSVAVWADSGKHLIAEDPQLGLIE